MQTDIGKLREYLPQATDQTIDILKQYHDTMLQNNNRESLFSASFALNIGKLYFADSVIGIESLLKNYKLDSEVYDFGGGNGFPGIIISILYPETNVIFVEKDNKKADFLKTALQKLNLNNSRVSQKQIEHLPDSSVGMAFLRSPITIFNSLILAGSAVKSGGSIFHFKADNWPSEVASCPTQIFSKWDIEAVTSYILPDSTIGRAVVKTTRK